MNPLQTLRIAMLALLRNKLRSFLTTLGIVIGVGAVIAMVAIGEGAKSMVEQSFASMGSNLIILMSGSTSRGGAFGGFGSMPTLTWDDLRAIQSELSAVRFAAATLRSNVQIVSEEENWSTQVIGTTPDYLQIRDWAIAKGACFTQSDVDGGSKVVVLGQTVSDKLYGPDADPIGQTVRVRNAPFLVVGLLARKGQSPMGQDYDDTAIIPQSTYQAQIQGGLQQFVAGVINVTATERDGTGRAQSQIRDLLRDRHHIEIGSDDDFSMRDMTEMAAASQQGTQTLTTLLASVAAVSLLVGGIGIMNIMLVSVTERTREIGLRMAVGAKPRHILAQFLVEALALSVAGGFLGIALGLFAARRMADSFGWPLLLRTDVIVLAVVFSAIVGIGFGLYPARKASLLDPIDALRYE
jgi:putative ABC transport system permease protein